MGRSGSHCYESEEVQRFHSKLSCFRGNCSSNVIYAWFHYVVLRTLAPCAMYPVFTALGTLCLLIILCSYNRKISLLACMHWLTAIELFPKKIYGMSFKYELANKHGQYKTATATNMFHLLFDTFYFYLGLSGQQCIFHVH